MIKSDVFHEGIAVNADSLPQPLRTGKVGFRAMVDDFAIGCDSTTFHLHTTVRHMKPYAKSFVSIDTAINQVDSPQCENKLRFVRLPLPLRRMFGSSKVATFALHDPKSDCFTTGFCEARYSLRSGNASQKLASEGSRRPRESINHRSSSPLFIAGAITPTALPGQWSIS